MKDFTIGTLQISPSALRKMADAIQEEYKTEGNVDLECRVVATGAADGATLGIKLVR